MTPDEEYGSTSQADKILTRSALGVWETPEGIQVVCIFANHTTCWSVTLKHTVCHGDTLQQALTRLAQYPRCLSAAQAFQAARNAQSKVVRLYAAQCYFPANQPTHTAKWENEWVVAGDVYVSFNCKGPVDVWQITLSGHIAVHDTLEKAVAALQSQLALDTHKLSALLKPEA